MKHFSILIFFIVIQSNVWAQTQLIHNSSSNGILDYKPDFNNNIFIKDRPDQDQRNIAICSAFNGWLYAIYWYPKNSIPYGVLLKSVDNGKTWITLIDDATGLTDQVFTRFSIVACGNDTSNLKVFLGMCLYSPNGDVYSGYVSRFNGLTGALEAAIFNDTSPMIWDLDLACDQNYQATGANPFSIAVVYSKRVGYDSVIVCTSSNGGISFDNKRNISGSGNHLRNVSISFGRSASYPEGKYFITWEEMQDANAKSGHIYTSHSEPNFNSAFTSPVQLDNLYPSAFNNAHHPTISCQVSSTDNAYSNLSELIVSEKYDAINNRSDIIGFMNKTAASSTNFQYTGIDTSTNYKNQPDIFFNSFDSTFMLTFYDSTNIRLPFLTKNVNLSNPGNWDVISNKYNTDNNLTAPHPEVILDYAKRSAAFTWIADRSGGSHAAMFDAQFNFPVGIREFENQENSFIYSLYPNPARTFVEVDFDLKEKENIIIKIYNPTGQLKGSLTNQSFQAGNSKLKLDVSKYLPGIYLFTIQAGNYFGSKKIQIFR